MLTQSMIYSLSGVTLFSIGLWGLISVPQILKKIMAVNMMGMGVFMVLVASAERPGVVDPVPHAMVLTGIVVAVAGTALALALVCKIHALNGVQGDNEDD